MSEYGGCKRCGASWKFATPHTTTTGERNGMFPLCEACWAALEPVTRLPYYGALCVEWEAYGRRSDEMWPEIYAAVMGGK